MLWRRRARRPLKDDKTTAFVNALIAAIVDVHGETDGQFDNGEFSYKSIHRMRRSNEFYVDCKDGTTYLVSIERIW